jgi:WD40 repeat protein
VTALAYSPDGDRVASVDKTEARLWDTSTGKERFKFSGRQGSAVAFSPDGKRLAVGWADRVGLYDAESGKELSGIDVHDEVKDRFPFPPRLGALAFSPDGRRLATAASIARVGGPHGYPGAVVKVWDAAKGKELHRSETLSSFVSAVSFSPDGKHLAGCIGGAGGELPEGGEVWVWDAGGKLVQKIQPFTKEQVDPAISTYFLADVSFSPDGKQLASAGSDGLIRVWNFPQGGEPLVLRGHQGWVGSIAFSPKGDRLASGGADRVVRVWDIAAGKEVNALRGHTSALQAVAFSPDGTRVASAGATAKNSGEVRVWDVSADQQAQTFMRDPRATGIDSVAFSPDSKLLASGSISGVTIHDVASGQEHPLKGRIHPGGLSGYTRVAFSPDGAGIATTGAEGVKLWDQTTGKMVRLFPDHGEIAQPPYTITVGLAFSPDGKHLATVGRNLLTVWEVATGKVVHKIAFHSEKLVIGSVAYSPDGRRIATATRASVRIPAEVKLWDAATGEELMKLAGGGGELAFSPDGRRLACCNSGGGVTVWETAEGKVIFQLQGHSGAVHSVAFSPDGKRIVTGSADETLMIWDARTGQEVLRLRGHGAAVVGVAFSPDGRHIASASSAEPSQVKLWKTGQ